MGLPDNSLDRYLELLAKVDSFTERVLGAYRGHIACGPGCHECCGNTFTVFAVEAYHLRFGFDTLLPDLKEKIAGRCRSHRQDQPCPLLEDGLCALYAFRPIICRTHGYPFTSSHIRVGKHRVTSFCEWNFNGMPDLSALSSEHILNLDLLNSALAAINHLFIKKQDTGSTSERVWLPSAILR